jgi:hypothetical protein
VVASRAAGATILTNWLSPRFSHSVWKRQRKEELRLATIASLIRLTSEFYQGWIKASFQGKLDTWEPSMQWYLAKHSVDVEIKALFTEDTHEAYLDLERRFSRDLGATNGRPSQSGFQAAYTYAYEKLFGEVFAEPSWFEAAKESAEAKGMGPQRRT